MKSKILFWVGALLASAGTSQAAEVTLWAKGVDASDSTTYYNTQQGNNPTCWAASGSNAVAHWQDNHVTNIPEGTPTGTEVYNTFVGMFAKHAGGESDVFYQWWLGHHSSAALPGVYPLVDLDSVGGYYKEVYASAPGQEYDQASQANVKEVAYSYWDLSAKYKTESFNYTTNLSSAVYYALRLGYAMVIDVYAKSHALTLYGATFDTDSNLITSVYVVDSGGACYSTGTEKIVEISVGTNGSELCLLGYASKGPYAEDATHSWTISDVNFLGNSMTSTANFILAGIPEPSAFGLLAGLGALALVASRRNRKFSAN